jgi:hypothetical protein
MNIVTISLSKRLPCMIDTKKDARKTKLYTGVNKPVYEE